MEVSVPSWVSQTRQCKTSSSSHLFCLFPSSVSSHIVSSLTMRMMKDRLLLKLSGVEILQSDFITELILFL